MKEKKSHNPHHDALTTGINDLLNRIPKVGSLISRVYLWRYSVFNSMIVGATGMIINFALYEGIIRNLVFLIWASSFLGLIFPVHIGLFFGMVFGTVIIFFWNYYWQKRWSLSINTQLYSMKKRELLNLHRKIQKVLSSKYEVDADDFPYSAQS